MDAKRKITLQNGDIIKTPQEIADDKWVNDITKLPSITWRDVTTYLLDTPSEFTKENVKAYKSLEAYSTFFLCGHVQNCFYADSSHKEFCFIKSEVGKYRLLV